MKDEIEKRLLEAIRSHSELSDEEIIEAGQYGADSGWSGFVYYQNTSEFYDKNEKLIWELLEKISDDIGEGIHKLIGSFKIKYNDLETFKNLLSWFALEETGHWLAKRGDEREKRH